MKKQEIKAIIFDVGAVLELGKYSKKAIKKHHNLSVHNYISKKFKISLDQWFDAVDTVYALSIEGKITKSKVLSKISKNLNISSKRLHETVVRAYKIYFKKNKELFKIAYKLKKEGYKIAILSDQWHLSKEALIPKKDSKKFNAVVISCDVGLRKPDPKIYKLVLKKLKLKGNQTVFIDNQKWNMPPAKKLGMKTILFKNNKQTENDLRKLVVNF